MKKLPYLRLLIVLASFVIVYSYLSPTSGFMGLISQPLGSITGGDPRHNAFAVTIESFYQKSCTVLFQSAEGNLRATYDPCTFSWMPASTDTALTIKTASRTGGEIQSKLVYTPHWVSTHRAGEGGDYSPYRPWGNGNHGGYENGMLFLDYQQDDIAWAMETDAGINKPADTVTPTCIHNHRDSSELGWGMCDNYIIDTSRTFKLVTITHQTNPSTYPQTQDYVPGLYDVKFSIVDDNFYKSEEYARNTIPTYPHYRESDCPWLPNYTFVFEEFTAGQSFSKDTLRYPLNYVCESAPVQIYDGNRNLRETSSDILRDLVSGLTIQVPANSIYVVEYAIQANKQLGLLCDPVEVTPNGDGSCPENSHKTEGGICESTPMLNAKNGNCETPAGLVILCTEGEANYNIGGCVIQAVNRCKPGQVEETENGKLICVEYIPSTQRCEDKTLYSVDKNKCCYTNQREGDCTWLTDMTYSTELDKCVDTRPLEPTCDAQDGEYLGVLS